MKAALLGRAGVEMTADPAFNNRVRRLTVVRVFALGAAWLPTTPRILLGATLGACFWYRGLPVPRTLDNPFSPGRWALIALHVSGVVAGLPLGLFARPECE